MKTVKGDIFIIPNETFKLDSLRPDSVRNTIIRRTQRLIGLKLSGSEIMAEVWITSPECDNWSSTYGGFQKHLGIELKDWNERDEDSYLVGYFPKLFPSQILEDKKEGDTIILRCPEYGVNIELTCRQKNYRYARFGNFEDVLKLVV